MRQSLLFLLPASLLGISFAYAAGPGQETSPPRGEESPLASLPGALRADVDLDGREDLLLVHPSGSVALYRQTDGELEPLLDAFGPDGLPPVRSAAFGDLDLDGAPDLFVVTRDGQARLFAGDGVGTFTDITSESGLTLSAPVLGGRWEDLDRDGRPDLVVATGTGFSIARNLGDGFVEMLPLAHEVATVAITPMDSEDTFATAGALDNEAPSAAAGPVSTRGEHPVPVSATSASGSRVPVAGRAGSGPGSSNPELGGGGPAGPTIGGFEPLAGGGGPCALTLKDAVDGQCLEGSTTPTLGMLHPLSTTFNVNGANDRVGIGTTNPGAKLTVHTTGETAVRATTDFGSAGYFSSTSTTSPALTVAGGDDLRAAQMLGALEVGYTLFVPPFFDIPVSRAFLDTSGFGGRLRLDNGNAVETVELVAEETPDNGAQLALRMDNGTSTIVLDAELGSGGPELAMYNRAGTETIELLAEEAPGNGAQLVLRKANGVATMVLDAETSVAAVLSMRNSSGTSTVEIVSEEVAGDGAQIVLRKADGTASIILDAEQGADGRITTEVLQITGGADLVEGFETGGVECEPGSVVVIDETSPGQLTLSGRPYDARVAGIVSGAGGVKPGLTMGQNGTLDGDTKVALTGRVYVRCTTENGPVRPGDMLTTSSTEGLAMRATDPARSFGAVIGKAMGELESGTGLVLVLVNLQ